MTKLTPEQQAMIDQVAASMEISEMPLDRNNIEDLIWMVSNEKTADQLIEEIKARYLKEKSSASR